MSNCPLHFIGLLVVSFRLDREKGVRERKEEQVRESTPTNKASTQLPSAPSPSSTVDAFIEDIEEDLLPLFFIRSVMV